MNVIKNLIHDMVNKLSIAQGKALKLQRTSPDSKDIESLLLALNRSFQLISAMKTYFDTGTTGHNIEDAMNNGQTLLETLEKMYGIRIEVDLETQRLGTVVELDMAKIGSVIENIIENAKNAGATVVKFSDRVVGDKVHTVFEDNGRGCKTPEKIGTGFTTGGTGIGTQSIKENIAAMGGQVWWEQGTIGMRVCMIMNVAKQAKAAQ